MDNTLNEFVQQSIENAEQSKKKEKKPEIKINEARLYTKRDYTIRVENFSDIVILQPTIGQIIGEHEDDESRFWSTANIFTTNSTSYKLMLWDKGIDWNDVSDFSLFLMLLRCAEQDILNLMFKDFIRDDFELVPRMIGDKQEVALYNRKTNVLIDEDTYNKISLCFRTMFNIFPKIELAADEATRDILIDEALMNQLNESNEEKKSGSMLKPIISACCNHPGFKYKPTELDDIGIYILMDAVIQLQLYESATAVMKGMYSGFVDGKKIDPKAYNFIRSGS